MGINQTFEQEKSLVVAEIGSNESNFSGPMAATADPMQASSCINNVIKQYESATQIQ